MSGTADVYTTGRVEGYYILVGAFGPSYKAYLPAQRRSRVPLLASIVGCWGVDLSAYFAPPFLAGSS